MKKLKNLVLISLALVLLSGCSFKVGDELLKAPKPSADYTALQDRIDTELLRGSVMAAPSSGTNRNTVQLVDIDADGTEEAIAFFRESAVSGKFYAVVYKKSGEEYSEVGRINGIGSEIDMVAYPKLSPVGGGGIAISWKMSNDLERGLTVARFSEDDIEVLLDTTYMSYTNYDIDGDSIDEIFTIYKIADLPVISMYKMVGQEMELISNVFLSSELESVSKITTGELISGKRAIAIDSRVKAQTGIVTDLIVFDDDSILRNLTIDSETGSSMATYRSVSSYTTKLYNNNILYIPTITNMKGYNEDVASLYITNWHLYDLYNPTQSDLYTYHSSQEGWYYKLDNPENITAVKTTASNIKITTFLNYKDEENSVPLFEIYVVPIDEFKDSYFSEEYLRLGSNNASIFICKNLNSGEKNAPSDLEIIDNFKIITTRYN